ncbi:MAG: hypothetical protein KAR05_00195 [Candidatus Omnitrophica bacterium]|nr:hypothetical protein [Candidatus Omnitrophota bacterium]
MIDLTKFRPRRPDDNDFMIRTRIGYGFIDKRFANDFKDFYSGCFNEHFNFHRPCVFVSIKELPDGKIRKTCKFEDYATPYNKLNSIPNAKQHLKMLFAHDEDGTYSSKPFNKISDETFLKLAPLRRAPIKETEYDDE